MKRLVYILISSCILFLGFWNNLPAQCAMCKASAETNAESGGTQAAGINLAVLYVLVICFIIITAISYLVWKLRNSDELNG